MGCPSDAELLLFASGTDPSGLIDAHLDGCSDCMAIVVALARSPAAQRASDRDLATAQVLADGEPRYRLDYELARGGMGRIYAAHDRLLDRAVALKLLRAATPVAARRFARERQITARLQHPAIVPVYDAGTLDNGEPFLAMRLVRGRTLDRWIDEARTLEARLRLLPAVITVADAIAYAHDERVIHRDLKPQNILLGPFGEVVVLDWGIARAGGIADDPDDGDGRDLRALARAATQPAAPDPAGPTLARSSSPDTGAVTETEMTRAGEVLGTLAYMAPEQAAGDRVDARADVFSLGAILYEVVSGVVAHGDRTSIDDASAPPVPLVIAADIPVDLGAIIQRATAARPDERYRTMRDFAEDLKRWQAGLAVTAYQYTPGELARRWIHRHRGKLVVAGALAAVAIVLGAFAVWRIADERAVAERERERAEQQRAVAETERAGAEQLVAYVLGDLRTQLEPVGRLDALGGVARAVLAYEQQTAIPSTAAGWLQRSTSAALAGEVAFSAGRLDDAATAYARSLAAADAAVQVDGDRDALERVRCRALLGSGEVARARGQRDTAERAYQACAKLSRDGDRALVDCALHARFATGILARDAGDHAGALAVFDDMLPRAVSRAHEAGPGSSPARALLVLRIARFQALRHGGLVQRAIAEAAATRELAERYLAARPGDNDARNQRGLALVVAGDAALAAGRHDDARAAYRAAVDDARAVSTREPANVQWQRDLSIAVERLGQLATQRGEPSEALIWLREGLHITERLAIADPDNVALHRDLGISTLAIADVLVTMERFAEARPLIAKTIEDYERWVGRPGEHVTRRDVASTWGRLADLELAAKRRGAAAVAAARAVDGFRAVRASGDTPQSQLELALALSLLARSESAKPAAVAAITEARAIIAPRRAGITAGSPHAAIVDLIDQVARSLGVAR